MAICVCVMCVCAHIYMYVCVVYIYMHTLLEAYKHIIDLFGCVLQAFTSVKSQRNVLHKGN